MSSDPNKSVTGDLGEGTGIRDNLDPELKKTDELLEESLVQKDDKEKQSLVLIGGKSQIRCHRCGTAKNQEDKGKFIQINAFIAWFHNLECHDLWNVGREGNYKTGAVIDEYGKEI